MVRVELLKDVPGVGDRGYRIDEDGIPVAKMLELIADGDAKKAPSKPKTLGWSENVAVKLLEDVDNKGKKGDLVIYPIKTAAEIQNVVNLQKQKVLQIQNLAT